MYNGLYHIISNIDLYSLQEQRLYKNTEVILFNTKENVEQQEV